MASPSPALEVFSHMLQGLLIGKSFNAHMGKTMQDLNQGHGFAASLQQSSEQQIIEQIST